MAKIVKDPVELVAQVRAQLVAEVNAELLDTDVMRFLVSRSLDVPKSVAMIQRWHVWWNSPFTGFEVAPDRQLLRPRDIQTYITDDKQDAWGQVYPMATLGHDKQGRPIYWEKSGFIGSTWSTVRKSFTDDELYLRHVGFNNMAIERCRKASTRLGTFIDKQVIIMDLKLLPFAPEWALMKQLKRVVDMDQDYYPETLGTLLVINAPIYFTVIWAVVRPWLDDNMLQKIQILGYNFLPVLRQFIDDSEIPEEYGGSRANFAWKAPGNDDP